MDDFKDLLGESTTISFLDKNGGFWQVEIDA